MAVRDALRAAQEQAIETVRGFSAKHENDGSSRVLRTLADRCMVGVGVAAQRSLRLVKSILGSRTA